VRDEHALRSEIESKAPLQPRPVTLHHSSGFPVLVWHLACMYDVTFLARGAAFLGPTDLAREMCAVA
jgi:hypothetical protein